MHGKPDSVRLTVLVAGALGALLLTGCAARVDQLVVLDWAGY